MLLRRCTAPGIYCLIFFFGREGTGERQTTGALPCPDVAGAATHTHFHTLSHTHTHSHTLTHTVKLSQQYKKKKLRRM